MHSKRSILAALLALLVACTLPASPEKEGVSAPRGQIAGPSIQTTSISSTLIGLNTLYQYLDANFLYDIDLDKIDESLTSALLSALDDPYSEFITKKEAEEFNESMDGTYVGIGTYLTKYKLDARDFDDPETYMVQITSPFPGGPADRAGIRSRDLISHINGESTTDLTATEASKKIRGTEGVPVVLTIHRGSAVFDVSVTPEQVTKPSVEGTVVPGTDIGYLTISDFNNQTYTLVTQKLDELMKQKIHSLILDLRNNGGGIVNASLLVADLFLDGGEKVVTVKYKEGSDRKDYTTVASNGGTKYKGLSLAILTNGGTASASEILTGALKDNGKATIIGSKTFGKGVMQDVIQWKEGFVKVTSAHYLTPSGADINKIGIQPDIEIPDPEYTDEETVAYYDFMKDSQALEGAFLKQHPDFTQENLELFAQQNSGTKVPALLLKLLIRGAYLNEMDYKDRPIIDTTYDDVLNRAIDYLQSR